MGRTLVRDAVGESGGLSVMGASRRRVEEIESAEDVGIPAERDQSRPTPVEKDVGESERERDLIEMKMTRYQGRSKEGERQHGLLLLPP